MSDNLKSIIYISKRCQYCRKLLLLLQNKPELKGSITITCVDDEPFPKIIKSVPSMISNGELWTADEIFSALEQDGNSTNGGDVPSIENKQMNEGELENYYESNDVLGFATIDDNIISDSYYEKVGGDNKNPLDVGNDGYIQKNKKTEKFDNDYERMMSERSELMNQIK